MFRPSEFYQKPSMDICPRCHSKNAHLLGGFSKRMFGTWRGKFRFMCKDCGRQWTVREGAPASVLQAAAGGVR